MPSGDLLDPLERRRAQRREPQPAVDANPFCGAK